MATHPDAVRAYELTGVRRYLELCDPGHPAYYPGYAEAVCGPIARGETPAAAVTRGPDRSELLARVRDCPDRGPVLPHTLQAEGCRCGELTACAAGRGRTPGRVTLRDCLECRAGAM
jgi:hypothetical protein